MGLLYRRICKRPWHEAGPMADLFSFLLIRALWSVSPANLTQKLIVDSRFDISTQVKLCDLVKKKKEANRTVRLSR